MGSMEKPLLPESRECHRDDNGGDAGSTEIGIVGNSGGAGVLAEVKRQFDLAGALVVANFMQFSVWVIATMVVGHLGMLELSSASVAASFANFTGILLLTGLSEALETLCGQAYGAKNNHLLGVYVQAAVLVLMAFCVPISILWLNMDKVLPALGQNEEISIMAGVYFRWLSPGLFAAAVSLPIVKFLQAQSSVFPIMMCAVLTVSAHIPTCYLLVHKLGFGFHGGALAVTTAMYVHLFLLLIYVYFSNKLNQTWKGPTKEAFGALTTVLKLAVPSAAMICLESWASVCLILLAGMLPNPQLQVSLLSICLTLGGQTYMIQLGLSGAVSTRVSNELGADRPAAAKFSVKVVVCISLSVACIIAMTEILVRNIWGKAFSDDAETVQAVANIMPLIAFATFFDGMRGVLGGVARGCGRQKAVACVNLGSYYAAGLPGAFLLGYYFHYGTLGLWLGFVVGVVVQAVTLIVFTFTTNWKKMAYDARRRVNAPVDSEAESPLIV